MSAARALRALETGLEALLSALGNAPAAEIASSEAAFTEVTSAFTALQRELEAEPEAREGQEAAFERCLRLYAVAVSLLAGRRDVLASERTVCVQARARLEGLHAGSASGASCDLSA